MIKLNYKRVIASHLAENIGVLLENSLSEKHLFVAKTCTIRHGGYIVLDFGEEICGRVHVVFGRTSNATIRIRSGESVAETYAELGEKNAGNNHSLRDASYPVVFWSDFSTSETGFRFVRIDVTEGEKVEFVSVFAESSPNGLSKRGYFECDDKRLNEIYETAVRTISLSVREKEIWDGVKRDRLVWIGDFYPELLASYAVYGDIPQFENVLNAVASFQNNWINDIPSYSAWWIVCLEKYYELSGNEAYVRKMFPYVRKIVNDFSAIIGEDGATHYENCHLNYFAGNEFFLDWPTNGTPDSEIGWRYLLTYALTVAKKLYAINGEDVLAVSDIIRKLDAYQYASSDYKQVTSLGVMAGRIGFDEAKKKLEEGGVKGWTTFLSFTIIEALKTIGEDAFALKAIKEYFGAMLDLGATTFWEDFDIDWLKDNPSSVDAIPDDKNKNIHADYGRFCYKGLRHSLCHGWSCGMLDFFSRHILGVVPMEPGYRVIKVEPHLCGLHMASGIIPTKYGDIHVKHVEKNGHIETELKLPEGIAKI